MIDDYEPMIPDSWWDRQVGGSPEEKTIASLRAENAKLRKYAELYAGAVETNCDLCPYCDDFEVCKDAEVEPMSEGCALHTEMREMGIEVKE